MNRNIRLLAAVSFLSVFILGGCGSKSEDWAYAHDPSTEILELSDNGRQSIRAILTVIPRTTIL